MLSLESTCAPHASNPADTPRELRGWLRGTGASTASRTGARICALASGERWWGAVMIYGSQGLCVWGSASPPPRRRLWELLPPRPSVHPRGRWTAAAWALRAGSRVGAMLHGATVGALPNPDGGWVWEEVLGKSRPRHPPEPGAERQLKHEPPGNTRAEFNSVRAAWGWHWWCRTCLRARPYPCKGHCGHPCPQERPRSDTASISFVRSLKPLSDWRARPRERWKRLSLLRWSGIRGWKMNTAVSRGVKPPRAPVPLLAVQRRHRLTALPRHCHRFPMQY